MTATNEDVLQALLSLDAYNRNATNANMRLLGTADGEQLSPQIGSAEFKFSSDTLDNSGSTLQGSLLSGFSASYYTIGDQTVIAYRGTDFDTSSATSVFELLKDIATGWLASGGFIDPEHFDPLHAPNPAMDPPLEAKGAVTAFFPLPVRGSTAESWTLAFARVTEERVKSAFPSTVMLAKASIQLSSRLSGEMPVFTHPGSPGCRMGRWVKTWNRWQ